VNPVAPFWAYRNFRIAKSHGLSGQHLATVHCDSRFKPDREHGWQAGVIAARDRANPARSKTEYNGAIVPQCGFVPAPSFNLMRRATAIFTLPHIARNALAFLGTAWLQ